MPIPGLCDTYEFADWVKVEYRKAGRPVLAVRPEHSGLLTVLFTSKYHAPDPNESLAKVLAEAEEMP